MTAAANRHMPQPHEIDALSTQLRAIYADVWSRIQDAEQALLEQWPALTAAKRLARLRELQALVEGLTASADEQAVRFSTDQLPRAFLFGAIATTTAASGGTLTGINLDALSHLAGDTYLDLLAATKGVTSSTKTLIRTLTRQHVADVLVRGDTAVQAGRDLRATLHDQGITAVTYANGTRHGLADYSQMVVRTKSAIAYNEGGFAALTAAGVDYVEVLDGRGCGWTSHDDPDKANGTIRPLEQVRAQPISHPHCRRSFGGRPDVTTAKEAATADLLTTAAQRADQAAVDASRELQVARRAAARALSSQLDRRAARILADGASRITSPSYARVVAARELKVQRTARARARSDTRNRAASRRTPNAG
jgi:hypothetical protein